MTGRDRRNTEPFPTHFGEELSEGSVEASNLNNITEVLVSIASGAFDVRAPRNHKGDPWDVLAFLANETADEVQLLVTALKHERQSLVEAQEKLHQSEKLAALGELAGGVAHELNQPLTVIQTLSELLLERPEMLVSERRRELEMLALAAKRMGSIVTAVRTFGRRAPLNLTPLNVCVPLREALDLFEASLEEAGIELETKLESPLPRVAADPGALAQVFINLLSNARDVLKESPVSSKRCITAEASRFEGGLRVVISDSGPGVSPETEARLFDPFFSTKGVGQGTGLGLSISHSLITEHHGSLTYQTNTIGGASFVVTLPAASVTD